MSDIFSTQKNGYNREEVDSYINLLKKDYEERLSQQKERIFSLKNELDVAKKSGAVDELFSLVEKTKQMERSTQSIYELEARKLKIICNRLNEYINTIENLIPQNSREGVKKQLDNLKSTIDISFSNIPIMDSVDPVRRLLAKMVGSASIKDDNAKESYDATNQEQESTSTSLEQIDRQVVIPKVANTKPKVVEIKKVKKEKQPEGIFNEFLNDNVAETQFEKVMFGRSQPKNYITSKLSYPTPNESGFDLKEAVNPKDDLDEIMKAFDFFDDGEGKK